ncbi:MAG: twin-arginine translocase TatA/TatE family subunit [Bdellovibrionaceae bacterium]|nr:twin-arginine translocase TatA/TatE family subunit [Pseudobdellovibrionaceae bacterium]
MFGLGFTEILLLILVAFLVFGPKQFPLIAKNFIKLLNELKTAFFDIRSEIYDVKTEANKQIHQIQDNFQKEFKSIEKPKKKENSNHRKK